MDTLPLSDAIVSVSRLDEGARHRAAVRPWPPTLKLSRRRHIFSGHCGTIPASFTAMTWTFRRSSTSSFHWWKIKRGGHGMKECATSDWTRRILRLTSGHAQNIITEEFNHVLDFASAIEQARNEGKPVDPFKARVDLWANRYPNIVNEAQTYCKPHDLYRWDYGDTVQHCSSCAMLNGIVATGGEWRASGVMPQNPPNSRFECGGWKSGVD